MKRIIPIIAVVCLGLLAACSSSTKLDLLAKAANKKCPYSIQFATITSIETHNKCLIYHCEMDENQIGGTVTNTLGGENKALIKQTLLQELKKSPEEAIQLCRESKYDIVYKITGKPSNETVEVVIQNQEL